VTWQYVSQHEEKCPPTTAAPPAIGTKHPLATDNLAAGFDRIVAVQKAVPV